MEEPVAILLSAGTSPSPRKNSIMLFLAPQHQHCYLAFAHFLGAVDQTFPKPQEQATQCFVWEASQEPGESNVVTDRGWFQIHSFLSPGAKAFNNQSRNLNLMNQSGMYIVLCIVIVYPLAFLIVRSCLSLLADVVVLTHRLLISHSPTN